MSQYGPPSGPYGAYPGQPDDAYSGHTYHGQQRDPYESPSDPWGQGGGDPWADPTAAHPPGPPPPAGMYGSPEPDWDQAGPPPERRGNTLLFVAVGILVLVVAGAVGYALYLLSGEEGDPVAIQTETPAPAPSGQTPPATEPDPEPTQDTTGQAAARAQDGDCLVNRGNQDEPEMQIVDCGADEDLIVYQVLERVDTAVEGGEPAAQNVSAQQVCQDTDGYTHHYFEVSELLSFVLCLQERA